ncbi:hypothetical protein M441DRAFT_416184 [Trichoderma asperellum CBS 433.97]|uniref:Secreted protein n=1 Tax=Trichoderma asperellum (strain ATCC 204424 / CBS 433.97 / NBRC 101777) TaxID=1042311 RepID=A0A2T3Z892_TRIA4|nr:hypothetical protein M441DRAFT_416184 [Trichoderma asperellum CBS 433.97]PTB41027.1 hypothetical protein M441DRAFT_416184 [Trichoderma asperellum CBS 433.97]
MIGHRRPSRLLFHMALIHTSRASNPTTPRPAQSNWRSAAPKNMPAKRSAAVTAAGPEGSCNIVALVSRGAVKQMRCWTWTE